MAWPTPSDYQDAIQNPRSCFADARLRAAQPALGPLGLPKVASGNYCSVYELRAGGRRWAVRCFNRQVPDAQQRYRTIDEHLNRQTLPWLVGFDFLSDGIRIRGRWYPVVVMDWVDGVTLSRYLEKRVQDRAAVRALADQWPQVIADLRAAEIAHGDLQHGNILIAHEAFRLVDYDNLFVPAFRGQPSPELGRLHYQHPGRTARDFDLDVSNFSALVIYLSLRALAADPTLWRFYNGENLVLTADDYKRPQTSAALAQMRASKDPLVPRLAAELTRCCALPVSQTPPLAAVLASLGGAGQGGGAPAVRVPAPPAGAKPDWVEAPPPSPSPASPRVPVPTDPWWERAEPTETPAPAPQQPRRPRRAGRPGWMSSQRPPPGRGGGTGGGTVTLPQMPTPMAGPAGCIATLVRSCALLALLVVLAVAGVGWWLYQNVDWEETFSGLPPISAPQGGAEERPPPASRVPQAPDERGTFPEPAEPPMRPDASPGPPATQTPPGPAGTISRPAPWDSAPNAPALLEEARRDLAIGDAAAALTRLARARSAGLDLDDADTARRYFTTLAEARARTGRYAEALPAFEKALKLDPENAALQQQYAAARRVATPATPPGPPSR